MITVTVAADGKPTALTKGFPTQLTIPGDNSTIADVKASIATVSPKVRLSATNNGQWFKNAGQ